MGLLIDDLATYAVAEGLGTLGTDIFRFGLQDGPDIPNKQIAIIPYPGLPSEQAFGSDSLKWEYPRVRVISRSDVNDPRPAYVKADAAYKAFGKITAETLSGTFYHRCTVLKAPYVLGIDDSGRTQFAVDLEFEKEVGS